MPRCDDRKRSNGVSEELLLGFLDKEAEKLRTPVLQKEVTVDVDIKEFASLFDKIFEVYVVDVGAPAAQVVVESHLEHNACHFPLSFFRMLL